MPEFDVLVDEQDTRWATVGVLPEVLMPLGVVPRRPEVEAVPSPQTPSEEVTPGPAQVSMETKVVALARESRSNGKLVATKKTQTSTPTLVDPYLLYKAELVDDLERARMANENRLRIMLRSETDSDGEERGWGLDPSHPEAILLQGMIDSLKALEKDAVNVLQKAVRRHPLWTRWARLARGVGEKQLGRLLAQIGDPYINVTTGLPRRVSALWAYSGLHVVFVSQNKSDDPVVGAGEESLTPTVGRSDVDTQSVPADGGGSTPEQGGDVDRTPREALSRSVGVAPRLRRGQRANWSTHAKVRAYLIAESTVKQRDRQCEDGHVEGCTCSVYRLVYERRRAHTAVTHGPDSESPWTKGHSQNDALRITSKAILKDLWRAARDWHVAQIEL